MTLTLTYVVKDTHLRHLRQIVTVTRCWSKSYYLLKNWSTKGDSFYDQVTTRRFTGLLMNTLFKIPTRGRRKCATPSQHDVMFKVTMTLAERGI